MLKRVLCGSLAARHMAAGTRLASSSTSDRFKGKVAVITGSTDGIGLAIAEKLGEGGANVVVSSRKQYNVDRAVAYLADKGMSVVGTTCSVAKAEDRTALLRKALDEFGRLDMVVPNAAAAAPYGPMFNTTEKQWDMVFDTNLKATFFLTKEALPELEKTHGSVVIITTTSCYTPLPKTGAYCVSKLACASLVRALADECAAMNIRINAVAPGLIDTRFSTSLKETPEAYKQIIGVTSMGRMGRPDEIANVVAFILSDEASYVHGDTWAAGGGYPSRI